MCQLAEKTSAARALQTFLSNTELENAELLKKVQESEARVAEREPVLESDENTEVA